MDKSNIFHAYDIRGVYPEEINPEIAYRLGWAFAKYLSAQGGSASGGKTTLPFEVVVGMDMRGSSPFLAREVIRGLNEQGIDVVEIGRVPTPAFYYAVAFREFAAGLMITASHNPKQYNGVKFCGTKAAAIGLGSGLEKIQAYFESSDEAKRILPRGKMRSLEGINAAYVNQDLSFLNPAKIKKLKIAADPANTMGSLELEELFKRIDCEPIKINWDLNGNMPVHEANPIKPETLRQLQEIIKNEKADFGIATDGDGDRIAFLDEKADIIPSAIVLGLVAQALLKKNPGARIGYDLRSSKITSEMIVEAGGEPVETMVGHSLIKKLMVEKDVMFAGELSSHYYFRENFNYESPIFVTAVLLLIRSEIDKPFSEIWRPYNKYFHSGELNFEVADKQAAMDRLEKKYADGKISKLDGLKIGYKDWWFNVRLSNTEPYLRLNLEAETEQEMKQKIAEVSKEITS
ncbi:MAG: hypothetical protein A2751_02815 [Candidatus Doudnabacteria bacterium RIFCSPHIGHO2_01_FULL_46_14]|uniref:Phosphomannomutase/phosphoglucomutase n=1 Tax=Candidatus Doudnabacteria bacterium RIFCSPHIGHO2_01_FULL_46_14 TaxID=1817824 RepID=A0A1F5NKL9_9BACT|nr:MAG: hypothetical protein A2751_02815 [Candidatus Doudnabacteria bacterium RIFCSPHIGHO2_01_FULL_46_14]